MSFAHNVASKDFYIAIVSTTVETANPESELKPGLDLLGPIKEKYGMSTFFLLIVFFFLHNL